MGLRSSFAIPVADEGTLSALRRFVKVGFPEWHVWTLPLVAYEYSYVLIEERTAGPSKLVRTLVERWLVATGVYRRGRGTRPVRRDARAEGRGYWSWTHWRRTRPAPGTPQRRSSCDLTRSSRRPPHRPSDDQRAAVVLSMLAEMNRAAGNNPYGEIISGLSDYWEASVEAAGWGISPPTPSASLVDPREFVDSFTLRFGGGRNGRYQADSWWEAVEPLARHWLQQLRSGAQPELTLPEMRTPSLIDVLNATWLCRFNATTDYGPEDADQARGAVDRIETAAKGLFRELLEEPDEQATGRLPVGRDRAVGRRPGGW